MAERVMYHRGRQFLIKENGLPRGSGLFWLDAEKTYIFAKVHGERFSCKTADWKEAIDVLEKRRIEWEKRENGTPTEDVIVSTLLDDLIVHYEDRVRRRGAYAPKTASIATSQINMKDGIRDSFGSLKVSKLQPEMYKDYRRKMEIKYAKVGKTADQVQSTIDHHLNYLRRALKLGIEHRKAAATVPIPKFDKANSEIGARSGIIDPQDFDILLKVLPEHIKPILTCCYWTGIRKKESTFIHRCEVNFDERLVKLRAIETKAGKARTCAIPKKYWSQIMDWEERTRREHPNSEYLFHLDGKQLQVDDIDDAFNASCETLGWHKIMKDDQGEPLKRKNGALIYDRSAIRWHDTRRTATTTVSNLRDVTDTDIMRSLGMTPVTHMRYDQNESAKKLRDQMDKAFGPDLQAVPTIKDEKKTKKEQLIEIKSYFDEGLIDESEYKNQKQQILMQP